MPAKAPAKSEAKKTAKKAAKKKSKKAAKPVASGLAPEVLDELLAVNNSFYKALTQGDLKAMTKLWDHSEDAVCVHPSGLILRGWEEIEGSWQGIFEGSPPKVIPESEKVSLRGDTVAVFCVERIISDAGMGLAGATNLFHKDSKGRWKMLWHHSALLPSMM